MHNRTTRAFSKTRRVLGQSTHFRELPSETLDRLAAYAFVSRLRSGELLHHAGEPMGKLWLVLEGGLKVRVPDDEGNAVTIAVLGEGSYYSAYSLVDGATTPFDVYSIGETEVAVFHVKRLAPLLAMDKALEHHILKLLAARLQAAVLLYRDVLAAPLPQRLARRLLSQALALEHGKDRREIDLRVSQADLATMVRAARSKINIELRRLERSGVLRLGYRHVFVRDLGRLCSAAGSGVVPL